MKNPYALILLVAATTAYGQIDNPPTSVNIVDATATGRAVLTATNAAAAATAVGLGTTNNVTFSNITANGIINAKDSTASPATNSTLARGIQWTNLGGSGVAAIYGSYPGVPQIYLAVGATNALTDVATFRATGMTVASNAVVGGTLAVSNAATFSTNVTVNGNLSVGSFTTTTPSTWALDATQTAAATNGVLTLPSNANVIRLTNSTAISGVSGGVLGAFYYLVNQATNAVTISNVGGITIDGAQNLTLSPNESATFVATGPTNVSVAGRGDLNNVTLTGVDNLATQQTASSGSSLMTRSLSDTRFYPLASYWLKAGDMDTFNGAGTGQSTWAEVAPIVNMVTPFSRAPRVVPAVDGEVTEGIFPIPVGWPAGATVRTTTYFVLAPSQSTTNSIFIRTYAFWTTNSSILTPVQNNISAVLPEVLNSDQLFTGTGTNAEYFAVTNTFTFATNANPQNRSIMFGRGGSQPTDTATNTIYFIGSHVELLP